MDLKISFSHSQFLSFRLFWKHPLAQFFYQNRIKWIPKSFRQNVSFILYLDIVYAISVYKIDRIPSPKWNSAELDFWQLSKSWACFCFRWSVSLSSYFCKLSWHLWKKLAHSFPILLEILASFLLSLPRRSSVRRSFEQVEALCDFQSYHILDPCHKKMKSGRCKE